MIYKILLIALLSLLSIVRNDMLLIIVLGFTIVLSLVSNIKFKIKFLEIAALLFAIFGIAFFSAFFEGPNIYNAIRDVWYLLKPILIMYAAYYVTSKLGDKEFFFRAVIYIGILAAVIHLIRVVPELIGDAQRISAIRYKSGRGNIVEIFSLAFLYLNKENKYFKTRNLKYGLYAILLSSILFYFSRTMTLLLFMIILSMKGYFKLTKRSVKYLSILLIIVGVSFAYLQTMDLNANQTGLRGFLYKIKIAPSELTKTDIDIDNHRDLWDHFRAYEASKAIESAKENGLRAVIFGNGLGSLVDLKIVANLGGKNVQFIPIIHNGYVFVFFKAGILGLLIYLLMLLTLYLKTYNANRNRNYLITSRFLSTIGVYYVFTSLVITGIYNQSDTMVVFLGGALFLETYFKNSPKQLN
jgi:hypothetical protein